MGFILQKHIYIIFCNFLSHSFRAGSITSLFGFNPTKAYPDYWLFHQNWKPMNVGLNLVTMQLLGNQWYSTKILYTTQADKVWNHLKVIHVWRDILPNTVCTVEIITQSGEQISKIISQTVLKNPKGTRSSPQNLNCYQPCHPAGTLKNSDKCEHGKRFWPPKSSTSSRHVCCHSDKSKLF